MTKAPEGVLNRVVLHLGDGLRRVVDPADVYYLEAQDEDTRVRLRSTRPLVDMRPWISCRSRKSVAPSSYSDADQGHSRREVALIWKIPAITKEGSHG